MISPGRGCYTQPLLFEDVYENEESLLQEKKKRNAIENHPLLGGGEVEKH
jgi:hypothetical protein